MNPRWWVAGIAALGIIVLEGGCSVSGAQVGGAGVGSPQAGLSVSQAAPADALVGAWRGSSVMPGSPNQFVRLNLDLQIDADGTYTMAATRATGGDNIGKPFTETGTVSRSGRLVVLKSTRGLQTTLKRSGGTLYGIGQDYQSERDVMERLDRVQS